MGLEELEFKRIDGKFVENHRDFRPVTVTGAKCILSGFEALIFSSHIHTNFDGGPQAYAPPISATQWWPKSSLRARGLIGNATSVRWLKGDTFHPVDPMDPIQVNNWLWTGVKSAKIDQGAREVDARSFLKDRNGNYPLFNPTGPYKEYYAPQTAINTSNGVPVDPFEHPVAALSAELRKKGGIGLGDFGLAMTEDGASSAYIYADAGGDISKSVGEVSPKLVGNINSSAGRVVYFIAFPNSRRVSNYAEPQRMKEAVQSKIEQIRQYANSETFVSHLGFSAAAGVLAKWGFNSFTSRMMQKHPNLQSKGPFLTPPARP